MNTKSQQIVWINMENLIAHPMNANVMSAENLRKLRRHIESTGRYEPLVVRKHPIQNDSFELINGHHRKRILEEIGETRAACLVWELSDPEALMLLATINRLGGEDAAGKRVDLIDALSREMELAAEEMAKFLPEQEAALRKILDRDLAGMVAAAPPLGDMDEPFTVFLKNAEKNRLLTALKKQNPDIARALMTWVHEHEESPQT